MQKKKNVEKIFQTICSMLKSPAPVNSEPKGCRWPETPRSPLTPPVSASITTHYRHSRFQDCVPGGALLPACSTGHRSRSSSLPPSLPPPRSSIMCRLLNGAKRLASDPFQWAMGSSGGAMLSWSGRSDLERPIRIGNVPTAFRKHYASGRLVPPDLPPLSHLSLQDIFFSWHPYIQFHQICIPRKLNN